jgi:hypothetical protein
VRRAHLHRFRRIRNAAGREVDLFGAGLR